MQQMMNLKENRLNIIMIYKIQSRHLMIILIFLNILTYPNKTFYEKYEKKQIRIKSDDALKMANKICLSMQKQFEDTIAENFPIKETVERITKAEGSIKEFDTEEIIESKRPPKIIKKTTKTVTEKVRKET